MLNVYYMYARKRLVRRGSGALSSSDGPGARQHCGDSILRGIQIGMFRPIRLDHTNCLQVAIKTHSFSKNTDYIQTKRVALAVRSRGSSLSTSNVRAVIINVIINTVAITCCNSLVRQLRDARNTFQIPRVVAKYSSLRRT